jgi:hypothetical protein
MLSRIGYLIEVAKITDLSEELEASSEIDEK